MVIISELFDSAKICQACFWYTLYIGGRYYFSGRLFQKFKNQPKTNLDFVTCYNVIGKFSLKYCNFSNSTIQNICCARLQDWRVLNFLISFVFVQETPEPLFNTEWAFNMYNTVWGHVLIKGEFNFFVTNTNFPIDPVAMFTLINNTLRKYPLFP